MSAYREYVSESSFEKATGVISKGIEECFFYPMLTSLIFLHRVKECCGCCHMGIHSLNLFSPAPQSRALSSGNIRDAGDLIHWNILHVCVRIWENSPSRYRSRYQHGKAPTY